MCRCADDVQRCKVEVEVLIWRSEVQRCRKEGAEVQRCRVVDVQICRCAEVAVAGGIDMEV